MADKITDSEDQWLRDALRAEPIADDGFSVRVVRRVRRKLWLRRLALPVAAAIGATIAIKPLASLTAVFANLASQVTIAEQLAGPVEWLPPLHLLITGAMLLVVVLLGLNALEE